MPTDSVLMVVVMKDGSLVGSEVFPPGTYRLGSGDDMDLRLEDARIAEHHASFLFVNGQVGIRDEGSAGGIFINGEKVRSARVQPRDEVEIAPFTLRMRLVQKRKEDSAKELSAFESGASEGPATEAAPVAAKPQRQPAASPRAVSPAAALLQPRPMPRPGVAPAAAAVTAPEPESQSEDSPDGAEDDPHPSFHTTVTVKRPKGLGVATAKVVARPKVHHKPRLLPGQPMVPVAEPPGKVQKRPVLRVQVLWGSLPSSAIVGARSFQPNEAVLAGPSDSLPMPLYGFPLGKKKSLRLAQFKGGRWRVNVPEGVESLSLSPNGQSYVRLQRGEGPVDLAETESVALRAGGITVRLVSELTEEKVKTSFRPKVEKSFWIPVAIAVCLVGSVVAYSRNLKDIPDFTPKMLPPIRAILQPPKKKKPEPKIEKEKKEEKIVKKEEPKAPQPKQVRPKQIPIQVQPATAAVQKLLNTSKITQKLFSAVDKIGSKGKLGNNMDYKASGLMGKLPLGMAGPAVLGIGKGFGGGGNLNTVGILGLRAGAGSLGRGNVGKRGVVGSPVTIPRGQAKVQGLLPMEAVRKVVEAHMGAIQRCYEGALIRTPSLAGKVTFEWMIGTDGAVKTVKTKVSTLPSNDVGDCIRDSLITWRFPQPKGGVVVVSYPFLFNSVGN